MQFESANALPVSTNYASIGRRFVALLIDAAILTVIGGIFGSIIPFIGGVVVWFFYAPIFETSVLRATLGKYLLGIQVADLSGQRITFKASIARNLLKLVSSAVFLIGYLFAFFTNRKQALHDLLTDTVVVYGRNETSVADAWVATTKEVLHLNTPSFGSSSDDSIPAQLERLESLRAKGALTEEEFAEAKRKILQ